MANRANPSPPDSYPTSRHVDGDRIGKEAGRPGYSDINRGHTEWNDSKTNKPCDPPEYASDRDRD